MRYRRQPATAALPPGLPLPTRSGTPLLELDDLVKRYGAVVALDGLRLTAAPRRLLGFLGPNGAGKTTAMRAVFGLVRLDRGAVRWEGRDIRGDDLLRFGYMPEQRGLYPRMPVLRQLVYLARLHGMAATAAERSARHWLERFELTDRADDPLSQLSHGNQQRVQLIGALVHDPDLLVLDEPFSGLDPLGVEAMSRVLHERAAAGAAVVFSSHQLDLVEELCDDVVIIAGGRHRVTGSLAEVRAASGHQLLEVRLAGGLPVRPPAGVEVAGERHGVTRMRVPTGSDVPELVEHLAAQGTIERIAVEPPPLSEVFRDSVGASIAELEAAERHSQEASA